MHARIDGPGVRMAHLALGAFRAQDFVAPARATEITNGGLADPARPQGRRMRVRSASLHARGHRRPTGVRTLVERRAAMRTPRPDPRRIFAKITPAVTTLDQNTDPALGRPLL